MGETFKGINTTINNKKKPQPNTYLSPAKENKGVLCNLNQLAQVEFRTLNTQEKIAYYFWILDSKCCF